MQPTVGDIITNLLDSRVRTVLAVDGNHIQYEWRVGLDSFSTTHRADSFYGNPAYKITPSKAGLIKKFTAVWNHR